MWSPITKQKLVILISVLVEDVANLLICRSAFGKAIDLLTHCFRCPWWPPESHERYFVSGKNGLMKWKISAPYT